MAQKRSNLDIYLDALDVAIDKDSADDFTDAYCMVGVVLLSDGVPINRDAAGTIRRSINLLRPENTRIIEHWLQQNHDAGSTPHPDLTARFVKWNARNWITRTVNIFENDAALDTMVGQLIDSNNCDLLRWYVNTHGRMSAKFRRVVDITLLTQCGDE